MSKRKGSASQVTNSRENAVLDLFGLGGSDVQFLSSTYVKEQDLWIVELTLKPDYPPCPQCGTEETVITSYISKRINHSILQNEKITLIYNARRYKCPLCKRTYYETNPFVFRKRKISIPVAEGALQELIDPAATFSSVAKKYHLSPTTIQNLFDKEISYPPATKLPRVMQIDETYSFRSENSKYVCMILNYDTQKPVDVLPDRKKENLMKFFRSFPLSERQKVKFIATDMYKNYFDVCTLLFPKAIYAIDRFHLIQDFDRHFNAIRVRVMKGCWTETVEYGLLKHRNGLLKFSPDFKFRNSDNSGWTNFFDPAANREYVYHMGVHANPYEVKEAILKISPDLREAYDRRCDLHYFFKKGNQSTAESRLRRILSDLQSSSVPELRDFGNTVAQWFPQIVNSFWVIKEEYVTSHKDGSVHKKQHRLTSSLIENRNKLIKQIKNNANGYTNWGRFRNRVLYVLNKGELPEELRTVSDSENHDE